MSARKLYGFAAILIAFAVFALAQQAQQPATTPEIKHVPIKATNPTSGKVMYNTYCAACHGTTAKGDGPAAPALKVPPSDLTQLAKKNDGKYPGNHVSAVIRGEADLAAHGSREMPVWGHLFRSISGGHEGEVQQRVANLTGYIESLQAK